MGGKSAPAPDYTPLANASKEAADVMAGLGREQLAFAKQQYADVSPLLSQIAGQQVAAQNQQMTQAQDYYNYLQDTYRPVEKGIVSDALNFNTDAYRQQLASKASADAGLAFQSTQNATARSLASMGVNPNSGRFATAMRSNDLGLAAQRASAMTNARTQAEQMGYARKLDAAGLGRNLSGASTAAYGGATQAGNSAGQNAQSAGNSYLAAMGQGATTIGQGLNTQVQGLSSVLNAQTQMAVANSDNSFLGDLGGLLGGAAAAKTAFKW